MRRFRAIMALPVAVAFVIGVALMGALASPETFRPHPVENAAGIVSEIPEDVRDLSQGGINQWRATIYFATHVPEVCWGDNAVNGFQRRQCAEFWDRLEAGGLLSLLPFALAGLVWFIGLVSLRRVYRFARQRIAANQPKIGGIITDPPEAEADLFSRLYCLRPIAAQVPGGNQIKVYIPLDTPLPLPGSKIVIFEPLAVLGELRHFGVFYAPHVAVFAGVRQ
jgi:hypothetical protein